MKKILFTLFLITTVITIKSQVNIDKYNNFIKSQKTSGKDYILGLFDKYDVVIICERSHPEKTQYDLFIDIIRDDRFINKVGLIVTEVGLSNLNRDVKIFLNTTYHSDSARYQAVLNISRNLKYDPIWEKYNYTDFLIQLNRLNDNLSENKKVNVQMADIDFAWSSIKSNQDYRLIEKTKINKRDSIMAANISAYYEKIRKDKRHKMLVILNYRHAFGNIVYSDGSKPDNTARYIFEKYPNQTVNVLINTLNNEEEGEIEFKRVQGGVWDSAFYLNDNKSIGFDFKNSPFGLDSFDMFPYRKHTLLYQDVFTGYCFYKPIEEHLMLWGIRGIFDENFKKEYTRRLLILKKKEESALEDIKQLNKTDTLTYFDFDKKLKRYTIKAHTP